MIEFECPHCNKKMRIPDEAAGRQGRCAHCHKLVTAPGTPPDEEVEPEDSPMHTAAEVVAAPLGTSLESLMAPSAKAPIYETNPISEVPRQTQSGSVRSRREAFQQLNPQEISRAIVGIGCAIPGLLFIGFILFGIIFPGKYNAEIEAVKATISPQHTTLSEFKAAPYNGGVAVANSLGWTYWVKDGRVYAANGLAMGASPDIPTAPIGIGYDEVNRAVFGNP